TTIDRADGLPRANPWPTCTTQNAADRKGGLSAAFVTRDTRRSLPRLPSKRGSAGSVDIARAGAVRISRNAHPRACTLAAGAMVAGMTAGGEAEHDGVRTRKTGRAGPAGRGQQR